MRAGVSRSVPLTDVAHRPVVPGRESAPLGSAG